jgi:hypothetical protein
MMTSSGWSLWVHFEGNMTMTMLCSNAALQKASDSCKLWPSRSRRIGASITLWLLANRMNVSMNHMVPISLSVQPLGDVVIALILLNRSGKEGVGPLERTKEGGADNPEGEMHSMTVISSRLSERT